jgi:solute carrier family 35 protein E3
MSGFRKVVGGSPLMGLSVPGNILSAVGLILTNKRIIVVQQFSHTTVFAVLHSYATFLFCLLLLLMGGIKYKAVNSYKNLFIISFGSLVSIIFMNLNLATNSVGFYQISKLAGIPMTLLIESHMGMVHQKLNTRLVASLIVLAIGMLLVAVNDVSTSALGFLWAFLGTLSTSVAQVFFSPLQSSLGLDPLQLLFHTSPLLTAASTLVVPFSEDMRALSQRDVTTDLLLDLLISCFCAIALNTTNYIVLSFTTPLTYQVIGHVKTVAIIAFGAVYYDQSPTPKMILGFCFAVGGVILYTEENRKQKMTSAVAVDQDRGGSLSPSISPPNSRLPAPPPTPRVFMKI